MECLQANVSTCKKTCAYKKTGHWNPIGFYRGRISTVAKSTEHGRENQRENKKKSYPETLKSETVQYTRNINIKYETLCYY